MTLFVLFDCVWISVIKVGSPDYFPVNEHDTQAAWSARPGAEAVFCTNYCH